MNKYQSVTTPSVQHDTYNILTELIFLNRFGNVGQFPWRGEHKKFWSDTVCALKKLMRDFDITADQMAFYIHKCRPKELSNAEFAKATFVPKLLFQKLDLLGLISVYKEKYTLKDDLGMTRASYKHGTEEPKQKTLMDLMRELENDKAKENRS